VVVAANSRDTADSGRLSFIDTTSGQSTSVVVQQPVIHAIYSPLGRTIAAAGSDATLAFYDYAGQVVPPGSITAADRILNLAYSPDATKIAAALANGQIEVIDASTGALSMPPCSQSMTTPPTILPGIQPAGCWPRRWASTATLLRVVRSRARSTFGS
jgi:WD40 repeat protein